MATRAVAEAEVRAAHPSELPLVSVVIPTFNRAATLPRAIESVRKQTYPNIEIIVVDDGSTDDTASVIERLADPSLTFIRHERNLGAAAARNTGIEAARGRYIAFLDSDDEWLPDRIVAAIRRFQTSELTPLGVVSCGNIGVRANGLTTITIPRRRGWIANDLLLQKQIGVSNQLLVVDARLLREHGIRYDPLLKAREEWDFVLRLTRHAQFDFVPEPLVIIHHHQGERLWNESKALAAGEYLHEKYAAELEGFPRAHSRFHLRNALTCLSAGEWRRGRREVAEAIRAMPTDWVAYLWFVLLLWPGGGKPTRLHNAASRILRRITFDIR